MDFAKRITTHFKDRMTQAEIDEALILAMDADKAEIERLRTALVESQAREMQLREVGKPHGWERDGCVQYTADLTDEESAQYRIHGWSPVNPADHSALDALLDKARAEERERIALAADNRTDGWLSLTGDEIRALK